MLVALGDLALTQSQPTEATWDKHVWIINFIATYPEAEIQYHTSDMCLNAHSNVS